MATVTVRNLPPEVRQGLRELAASNGRSMEAEARAVLTNAVKAARKKPDAKAAAAAVRRMQKLMADVRPKKGDSLVDEFLAERRAMWGEGE